MIAITGGGTGGHLTIAKAIKEELNKRGIKPVFIGSINGQDRLWFERDEGFSEKYFLKTSGVVNKKGIRKLISLQNIINQSLKSKEIFKKHQIDTVFSVGGYSAAVASIAAVIYGKRLFLHEQNSIIGTLNRVLKPFCEEFFCSFYEKSPVKDYPINKIFFENARIRKKIKTVIFLGGSQGASAINDYALSLAKELNERGIKIIHQCGKRDFERVKEFYEKNEMEAICFDFTKELPKYIKEADFAISRAGASTLFELAASALPSLFIPYPYAAKDHQYHNALFLKKRNLAFLERESNLKKETLLNILDQDVEEMSRGLKNLIRPHGAEKIVDIMLKNHSLKA